MITIDTIQHCYNEHVKDIGEVKFTFEQYSDFWKGHSHTDIYLMRNRDGSYVECKVAYYPIPYYSDLRALVELPMKDGYDFREVPIVFLKKKD